MARKSLKNIFSLLDDSEPIEKQFLRDLQRSIELTDKKNKRTPSQTYKPSSMKCIRNMFYQVTGTEQDESETGYALIGICNSGSDIHERTQQAVSEMKSNNIDCEYMNVADFVTSRRLTDEIEIVGQSGMETKLYHKVYNMSFLCDGIIKYKNKYYILELKTESSSKFMNRNGVNPDHYNQGIAYSLAFGLNEVIFVYINRDVLTMKAFMFRVDDSMRESLKEKILACNMYVDRNELPPKSTDLSKSTCTYCNYKARCERNEV